MFFAIECLKPLILISYNYPVERVLQPQVLEQHSTRLPAQLPVPSSQLPVLKLSQLPVPYRTNSPSPAAATTTTNQTCSGTLLISQTGVPDKADKPHTSAPELEVSMDQWAYRIATEQPSCDSTAGNLTVLRRAGPVSQPCAVDANGRVAPEKS